MAVADFIVNKFYLVPDEGAEVGPFDTAVEAKAAKADYPGHTVVMWHERGKWELVK